jgi:hypothetical protein
MEIQKPTFVQVLKGGLISGVIAVVLNGIWNVIAQSGMGIQAPLIGFTQTTLASIIPMMIGAVLFFLLVKYTAKGDLIFAIIAIVFTILSLYGTIQPVLPDGSPAPEGFTTLTLPMHLIAGGVAVWGIPRFSK